MSAKWTSLPPIVSATASIGPSAFCSSASLTTCGRSRLPKFGAVMSAVTAPEQARLNFPSSLYRGSRYVWVLRWQVFSGLSVPFT